MDTIRKAPLRKILAIWAALLVSFVLVYTVISGTELSSQAKDIVTYVVSVTIGAYYASSSYEAVRKGRADSPDNKGAI
jgi:hypothetical protein